MQLSLYNPHNVNKCLGESPDQVKYSRHKVQVFVITNVGKPIYTRYGDELDLASFLATLAAIIAKFNMYYPSDKAESKMQQILHKNKVIYLLYRKQICLICYCSKESYSQFLIE